MDEHPWADLDWTECARKVRRSPHFVEQASRVYPAYRLLHGDMTANSLEEFLWQAALLVAVLICHQGKEALEKSPWPDRTGNNGGLQVIMEDIGLGGPNYRFVLHGPFATDMRMTMEDPEMVEKNLAWRRGEDVADRRVAGRSKESRAD